MKSGFTRNVKFWVFFNRIETYKKRSTGVNETDLSLRSELTKLEMKLLESQELVYLRGKVSE